MGWGDEIMVTGHVRDLQKTDPRRVRVMYENANRWPEAFHNNPRLAQIGEQGNFQEYRPRDGYLRPYMTAKTPTQWSWKTYTPPVGELYLNDRELEFGRSYAGRVIVEPHIKPGASPNKQWGWVNWNKLAWLLRQKGHTVAQMAGGPSPVLEGVELISTRNLRHAAAVLANARAAVLPEGGLHHTAAVFGVPSVVIYGGFISPAVTGYAGHRAFFVDSKAHPLGCGMRVPCEHCVAAMAAIKPEAVALALGDLIGH
jgi:ADP-heptose:LPS heptosyltransferase